jgi:cell cycle sensor histidine kinase DivJ
MLTKETALRLDADRRNEYAGLINSSGHHLLSVVNGILDMSKIETGNFEITPEPFAPAEVVTACCGILALRAREAGVHLEKLASDSLPEIIADKRALNQILLNLLSNAIRFTDRGGKVTISARAEATSILFAVEDNGVGISDEDLARVGEPYFQAGTSYDRRHGGTGLGLSIVKGLVRLHGGELSIRSRVGEGTRVTVRLPLDCERVRPGKKSARESAGVMSYLPAKMAPSSRQNDQDISVNQDLPTNMQDLPVKKSA